MIEELDQRLAEIRQQRHQLEDEEGRVSMEQAELIRHWY
jgi:hypothetical protein